MIFITIGLIVTVIALIFFGIMTINEYDNGWFAFGGLISTIAVIILAVLLPTFCYEARINKTLIKSHLENPSYYTYAQLAEHNELVTKLKAWQGTIFSFYNDTDLQTIDIDNISAKVDIENCQNIMKENIK